MKRLVPLIALVPLIVSIPFSGHFVYPTLAMLGLLWLRFAMADTKRPKPLVIPVGMFLLAPAAAMWALSERKEGREFWGPLLWIELGLGSLGTLWLLNSGKLDRKHVRLVIVALLVWALSYFGGASGGAENMRPMYSNFSLDLETMLILIGCTRKVIHAVFYSTLATQAFLYLQSSVPAGSVPTGPVYFPSGATPAVKTLALQFGLEVAAIIAVCDEWRQNMMPNREGSYRDVFLDLAAASIWLWWKYVRTRSATPATPEPDARV